MLNCCLKNIGLKGAQTVPRVSISLGPVWRVRISDGLGKDCLSPNNPLEIRIFLLWDASRVRIKREREKKIPSNLQRNSSKGLGEEKGGSGVSQFRESEKLCWGLCSTWRWLPTPQQDREWSPLMSCCCAHLPRFFLSAPVGLEQMSRFQLWDGPLTRKRAAPTSRLSLPSLPQQIGQKREEFFSTLYWFMTEREGMQRHESPRSVQVRAQTSL